MALFIALAGAGWYAYSRANTPAPPPPEAKLPAPKLPPRVPLEKQIAQQMAKQAEAQVKAKATPKARKAKQPRPAPQTITLDVRPEDIVQMLSPTLRKNDVHDISVYFGAGTLAAQGSVKVKDRQQTFTARAKPRIRGGAIGIEIIEAKIGSLPVPDKISSALTHELERKLTARVRDATPKGKRLVLESLKLTPGRMIVKGQVKGG